MSGKSSRMRFINSYINQSDNVSIEKFLLQHIDKVASNNLSQTKTYADTSLNLLKNQVNNKLSNIVCESIQYNYSIGDNTKLLYNSAPNGNSADRHKCLNYIGGMLEIGPKQTLTPNSVPSNDYVTFDCFDFMGAIGNDGFELLNDAVLFINIDASLNFSGTNILINFNIVGFNGSNLNTVYTSDKVWSNMNSANLSRFNLQGIHKVSKSIDYSIYKILLVIGSTNTAVLREPTLRIVRIS